MDINQLKNFIAETFFNGGDYLLDLANFINLSKDDQISKIKFWAQGKINDLNNEKNTLPQELADKSAAIDIQISALTTLTK